MTIESSVIFIISQAPVTNVEDNIVSGLQQINDVNVCSTVD